MLGCTSKFDEGFQLRRQTTSSARESLVKSLRGLIDLYPNHIWKEDYLLFPMTNKVLGLDEQRDLLEKFERVEDAIGRDAHRRFEQLAENLSAVAV